MRQEKEGIGEQNQYIYQEKNQVQLHLSSPFRGCVSRGGAPVNIKNARPHNAVSRSLKSEQRTGNICIPS